MAVVIIQRTNSSPNRLVREEHSRGSDSTRFHGDYTVTANRAEGTAQGQAQGQWNRTESPQITLCINGQLIFDKGAKAFQNMVLGQLNGHMRKRKTKN